MSQPRSSLAAVATNGKVHFGSGFRGFNIATDGNTEFQTSARIDIYDDATNSWSTSSLDEPKQDIAAVAVENRIFWVGGDGNRWGNATSYNWKTCRVEIEDVVTGWNSTSFLFEPEAFMTDEGENAVVKDNKIIFFTGRYTLAGDTRFNIYDIASNSWSIGVLPINLSYTSIVALNNNIYLAGDM